MAQLRLEDQPEETGRYHSSHRGPAPRVVGYATMSEELDAAAHGPRWAEQAAQEGRGSETIAILVRDCFQRDRVVSGLAKRCGPVGRPPV